MGRLPRRHGSIDWAAAHRQATEALVELGVHVDSRARVGTLSIEMQQEVEVARAVSADSRVIVLDEATSSLSEAATQRLLERLELLRARGVAIVFISHRLREMYQCCSRVDGAPRRPPDRHRAAARDPEGALVRMMVGREITDLFRKRSLEQGAPVLSVERPDDARRDGAGRDASRCARARSSASPGSSAAARASSRSRSPASCPPTARSPCTRSRCACALRARRWTRASGSSPRIASAARSSRRARCCTTSRPRGRRGSPASASCNVGNEQRMGRRSGGALQRQDLVAARVDRAPLGRQPAEGRPRPAASRSRHG